MRSLMDMTKGETGYISDFVNPLFTCKFYTLGIVPHTAVTMVRKSPFGGAFCIKIGDSLIALRYSEAQAILLK